MKCCQVSNRPRPAVGCCSPEYPTALRPHDPALPMCGATFPLWAEHTEEGRVSGAGWTEREAKLGDLRRQLSVAVRENRLMTCGTLKTTTPGLTPNHAYAVLGYDAKTDLVKLWNPHGGSFTPKGTSGLAKGYPMKDGVFQMPAAEWVQQFSGMAFEVTAVAAK